MTHQTIVVPDIGGAEGAEVVELLVAVGDAIELEQSLIVLESDKASMEIPASFAGVVVELKMVVGDQLSEGDAILILDTSAADSDGSKAGNQTALSTDQSAVSSDADLASLQRVDEESEGFAASADLEASARQALSEQIVEVPDIGTDGDVEVVELCVSVGDTIEEGDSVVVLESDKASMEVPSPAAGEVLELLVAEGASVNQGAALIKLSVRGGSLPATSATSAAATAVDSIDTTLTTSPPVAAANPAPEVSTPSVSVKPSSSVSNDASDLYVGPAVRKLAREFGIDLKALNGSGPKGRIVKEDLHAYVSRRLADPATSAISVGSGIPEVAEIDFSRFGPVRHEERSRIDKVTATNMSKSWLNVPHVTQFDDADITDLEAFRRSLKAEAEQRGSKLSPVPFIIKAVAVALYANPKLKSSLAEQGDVLVYKDYCHIGVAVDTPNGLVVPVIRDADKKSIWTLSDEIRELATKAKEKKLKPDEMQGAVFTVSSLGKIGGRGFTPIVNTPEVGILGVGKAATQPVWDGSGFQPRTMLPVSLSYDHRVVNGGDAGRFLTHVVVLLDDIRHLAMN
ncbi:MAG: dihydrolipoyllysine-residue acetyltransferase [Pseudomonadota bacterium]|nr:dihydrolipoyllysine-residue acetyltransferase [Pseudomonadota bacterium]